MTVNICKVSKSHVVSGRHMWNASSLLPLDFFVNINWVVLSTEPACKPLKITRLVRGKKQTQTSQCGFNLYQTSLFNDSNESHKKTILLAFNWHGIITVYSLPCIEIETDFYIILLMHLLKLLTWCWCWDGAYLT